MIIFVLICLIGNANIMLKAKMRICILLSEYFFSIFIPVMETKFLNIDYLASGTDRQRRAYEELKKLRVFEDLAPYGPLLAGTVPISIDIPSSDLDIVCQVDDPGGFSAYLHMLYGEMSGFRIETDAEKGVVVCNFSTGAEEIEIYGSPVPARFSNAFLHMRAEDRILRLGGEEFRGKVIAAKEKGVKTEPAFAGMLGLTGDPYENMKQFADIDDESLRRILCSGR